MTSPPFRGSDPHPGLTTLAALRARMTELSPQGASYLDHLVDGDYFGGRGVFVNDEAAVRTAYDEVLAAMPHLRSESPYEPGFRRDGVRVAGENPVLIGALASAPEAARRAVADHAAARAAGTARPVAFFVGGPAAKIAALVAAPAVAGDDAPAVVYALDRAAQSNESGSASYEHVNHANALNAEFDNTGLGILLTALRRAVFGEPDPEVALDVRYRKVDLWPRGVHLRDLPIYLENEIHGHVQALRKRLGRPTEHTLSRRASLISTRVLDAVETRLGVSLRLDGRPRRAVFLYFTPQTHAAALVDDAELRHEIGLDIEELGRDELRDFYGEDILERIVAADLFHDNACIRHGFDRICLDAMARQGVDVREGVRVAEVRFEATGRGMRAAAVCLTDPDGGHPRWLAVDHLGLSLGPTATYRWADGEGAGLRLLDRLGIGAPVPHQTIATGLSAQVLFRIVDAERARELPFTGMKQTHFVEVGRSATHVVMKLTCGGVIGLPVYSRSYGLGAIASLLRVIGPGCGLAFEAVVTAWPCTRGINGPNNGQVVRLADNAAIRFGEGGTGMSKMGSNAQTLWEASGLSWPLGAAETMPAVLWSHTVVDRRARVARRIGRVLRDPAADRTGAT